MKRSIFALMIIATLAVVGCSTDIEAVKYKSSWYIKNTTSQPLRISPAPFGQTTPYTIEAGETATFYARTEWDERPYFGMMLVCFRAGYVSGEPVVFEVLDTDDVVLKTWTFNPEAGGGYYGGGDASEPFFAESKWYAQYGSDRSKSHLYEWTFEILPEDIAGN